MSDIGLIAVFEPDPIHDRRVIACIAVTAKAAGVDTTLISSGGAAPLAAGEKPRPVVAKDVVEMYTRHAAAAYEDA